MDDAKLLQLIRDKILNVTTNTSSDLDNAVYLQQIRDAILGITLDNSKYGNLDEAIYLQQIRDAILGVPIDNSKYGSLDNAIYLQQIRDAYNGITARVGGGLDDDIYLAEILAVATGGGAPSCVITSSSSILTNGNPTVTFTFDVDVTGFALGDITVGNGAAGSFTTVSAKVYTAVITPTAAGTVTVDVAAGVCTSASGTPNTAAAQWSIVSLKGATGNWDASDLATMFTDAGVTPVASDGDLCYRIADKSGSAGNRYLDAAAAGVRPLYKINQQNGLSSLLFDGIDDVMTGVLAISNFIANNACTLFVVATPINISTNSGAFYDNDSPFEDAGGYFGVSWRNVPTVGLGNYSGASAATVNAISLGVAHIFTGWHSAGNLISQINGGGTNTAASGNTDDITGIIRLGRGFSAGTFPNYLHHEIVVFNTVLSAAVRNAINAALNLKWNVF